MKTIQQNSDFLHIGKKLLLWYRQNARILPWRNTKNPYNIWISEIILQQTRVEQGLGYYLNFIQRFPNAETLAKANIEEILLYWKGLGYYSRAINLHKAAQQIYYEYQNTFPQKYEEILKLKGIGKYTAAAIASICFNQKKPAIDGNFYRVLSRIFADEFDISKSQALQYFSELALSIMPNEDFGDFNQAIMDLGAKICKPKNPDCENCPIQTDCLAFHIGKTTFFPIKTKKIKPENLNLTYYFIQHQEFFLIKQRDETSIWKKLFDFPEIITPNLEKFIVKENLISHKLTHKNLNIKICILNIEDNKIFKQFQKDNHLTIISFQNFHEKSFPKPLEKFLEEILNDFN